MIWLALTVWLVLSVVATLIVGRLLYVCAQADKQAADDRADSERLVTFQEFNPTFHAALTIEKGQHDHA